MEDFVMTLVRDVGPIGLIALAAYGIAQALRPAITALADALRDQATAYKAALQRWEESDKVMDGHKDALAEMTRAIRDLHATDLERVEQNKLTAAQISGAREDINALSEAHDSGLRDIQAIIEREAKNAVEAVVKELGAVLIRIDTAQKATEATDQLTSDTLKSFGQRLEMMCVMLENMLQPAPDTPALPEPADDAPDEAKTNGT